MDSVRIKTMSRIHKVARLTIAGLADARIATIVGLTLAGLNTLKQRQDYKDITAQLLVDTTTQWDEELALDVNALRQEFAVGVPLAMRTLLDTVKQKKDLKSSMEAAKEILDRDPRRTFSKNAQAPLGDGDSPLIPQSTLDHIGKEADIIAQQSQVTIPREKVN